MSLLEPISDFAKQYAHLLGILGALAAPGGVWFWVEKYRNRTRIVVRRFALEGGVFGGRGVVMELESLGSQLTSLEPTFTCSFLNVGGQRRTVMYRFQTQDRRLPPHEVRTFVASHSDPEPNAVIFANYMFFRLCVTKGAMPSILFRDIQFAKVSRASWFWAHAKATLGLSRKNAA